MPKIRRFHLPLTLWLSLLLMLLLSGACVPPAASDPGAAQTFDQRQYLVGPLGAVIVGPDEDIHIRSMAVLTSVGDLGSSMQRAVAMAVADYGPIKGHNVNLGAGLDSLCTPEGGAAAADTVTGDRRVVGIIGTSCSAAAVAASPIISEAGLVMVSPTNTAPALTSDLRGNAGPDYHPGYFRTSNNDLYEAEAVAEFAYDHLGLRNMAVIHDGDPYTSGLAGAFATAFAEHGGSVTVATVNKGDTDMRPVLTELAAGSPDGLFLPLFPAEAAHVIQQTGQVAGLEEVPLIGGAALLDFSVLNLPESEGTYFSAPELHFEHNVNQTTGKSGRDLHAAYEEIYHESPTSVFLAHAYDAATILLHAIEEVAVVSGDSLYIDRARLRAALTATYDFEGIIGPLTCDQFGDCGTGHVQIVHHTDAAITDLESLPIVYFHLRDDHGESGH